MDLKKGMKFNSFAELQDAIRELEKDTNALFVRTDCSKTKNEDFVATFVYDRVMFACKQGRERKPRGTGERKHHLSVKLGCTARVRAVLRQEGGEWALVLSLVNLLHDTHIPSKEVLQAFPETKRINETLGLESVSDSMHPVSDVKRLDILPKDFVNAIPWTDLPDSRQLDITMDILREGGGMADLGTDFQCHFQYLSYCTREMLALSVQHPKVLLVDITYKTNMYRLPLLTIMCVDDDGKGHPIFHSFLASEAQGVLAHALDFFKGSFNSTSTSCIFVDKYLSGIGALFTVFPETAIILSELHVTTAVRKALRSKGLSSKQAEVIMDLFTGMKDALTPEEYTSMKLTLTQVCSTSILHYFETNWFCKPSLWAAHRLVGVRKLQVTTTNQCESYSSKIKLSHLSSLSLNDCVTSLIQLDSTLYSGHTSQNLKTPCTKPVVCDDDAVLSQVFAELTPYAADLVAEQYRLMQGVAYTVCPSGDGKYVVSHSEDKHTSSCASCSCPFFVDYDLPCRHIFSLRSYLELDLYAGVPVGHRFRPRVLVASPPSDQVSDSVCASRRIGGSQMEKYKSADVLMKNICSYMSLLGDREFEDRYLQLDNLFSSWTWRCEPVDTPDISSSSSLVADGPSSSKVSDLPSAPLVADGPSSSQVSDLPSAPPVVNGSSTAPSPSFGQAPMSSVRVKDCLKNRINSRRKRKAETSRKFSELSPSVQCSRFLEGSVIRFCNDRLYSSRDIKQIQCLAPILVYHDFSMIQEFFDADGWSTLISRVDVKLENNDFICGKCMDWDDEDNKWIQCDGCCLWFHYSCVDHRTGPKANEWYCSNC